MKVFNFILGDIKKRSCGHIVFRCFEVVHAVGEILAVQFDAVTPAAHANGAIRYGHQSGERIKYQVALIGVPANEPLDDIELQRAGVIFTLSLALI